MSFRFTFPEVRPLPGLEDIWSQTTGDPAILIAILDGPVDLTHPSFAGALIEAPQAAVDPAGRMAAHGTHVASIIFSQPSSGVRGVAPSCRGLVIPIFSD